MKKITYLMTILALALTATLNAQNYGLKTTGTAGDGFSSNEIGALLSNQTAFTIEFWYEIETFAPNTWIFKVEASGNNRIGLLTPGADNGGVYVRIGDGTSHGQQPFWNTALISANSWNHVALTFDAGTVKLYINGIERNGGAISGLYPSSTGDLSAEQFQIGWTTEANIDELRITAGTALSTIDTKKSETPIDFDAYFDFDANERPTGAVSSNSETANIGSNTTIKGQINNFGTTYQVLDNTTLKAKTFKSSGTLKVYPNPANDYVNIQLPDYVSGVISIYNITGKLVAQENVSQVREVQLSTHKLSKGIYMLSFENQTIKKVSKLIVQ
ncbi:T9SS type A sorting domain-containing protein [Aestuariibaculum sp. M13]|uniref:T9SS type A sorting domain-containing protein n=1 Tax=Aestuariibaculum sp. M13 TaxID=2967132 RepID=UPI002159FA04|nr:T9SS type A sorting domain-containing protein [Aestuariibaculum sp. M13]MCR8668724.1 T9SS type A sorting domain-containing protein [Aestuariibaculum sp. M13]